MAVVRIPEKERILTDKQEIAEFLATCGIDYEYWPSQAFVADASAEDTLRAYENEIEELKERGGYVTADVIDVHEDTPGLEVMLAKFNREHWHDEDEVRFIIAGHGLFHIHPKDKPIVAIEVEAGDLIRVPRGTFHWFDLCSDRRIRAIRLFQDMVGWTPYYSESGAERKFQPVCFGQSFLPRSEVARS
ncbi:MAG TPA: cupin domain-containing protein [Pyrinomonadaceae bacterium]|nr:cupin domain-containing protein [Pyrinomonadaceae bacterium]